MMVTFIIDTPCFPLENHGLAVLDLRIRKCPLPNRQTNVAATVPSAMPQHSFEVLRGESTRFSFTSKVLENTLGDPIEREVLVHVPPGVEGEVPCIIYLAPYTGTGMGRANWRAFDETLPQRFERLIREGKMGPAILVMPDTFTSLGGNQFIDSPVMGNWGTWLAQDLQRELSVRYSISGFALVGKSSGGYGALVRGMMDDSWDAVACHSGDCGFNLLYGEAMASCLTRVEQFSGVEGFLTHVKESKSLSHDDFHTLMICAMSASYDPLDKIQLPVDSHSCEFITERWDNWLSWDPLNLIEDYQDLPPTWIDVGDRDQYHIQYGIRLLIDRLNELSIPHHHEEFSGTHSGIDNRLDLSIPWLFEKMTSTS